MVRKIVALTLTLAALALPLPAQQEDEMGRLVDPDRAFSRQVVTEVQGRQGETGGAAVLNLGIGLAGLLAVGGLAWWWAGSNPRLRRLIASLAPMKLISRLRLGRRHEVVLIKVGGRALLIGASPRGLNTLAEFTDPAEVARLTENPAPIKAEPVAEVKPVEAKPVEPPKPEEPKPVSQPRLSPVRAELAKLADQAA